MTSAPPEPWQHHFVPRSLLKYFAPTYDSKYLYVFDKHTGKSFRASLMAAGSENGFNTYQDGGETVNFEYDFDEVDALLANSLKEIHHVRSICEFSKRQRQDWADLVATQLVRTPITRSTPIALVEHLDQEVKEIFGVGLGKLPTENDARKMARNMFAKRHKFKRSLAAKDMVLFAAPEGCTFRISDRPVTRHSTLPYGNTGLDTLGAAIFMPLGRQLMLGMMCPSMQLKLNKMPIESMSLPDEVAARLVALRGGLATGVIVQMDKEEVERHNLHHIAHCSRFVYGPSNEFEDAKSVIAAKPDVRSVRSSIQMGRMGAGPAPNPAMPAGLWLVLFGRTEGHMLEVTEVKDSYPLKATVQSRAALTDAMVDGPFKEMRYYVDGQEVSGMRDVEVVLLDDGQQPRVQVRHTNPSHHALMKKIGAGP